MKPVQLQCNPKSLSDKSSAKTCWSIVSLKRRCCCSHLVNRFVLLLFEQYLGQYLCSRANSSSRNLCLWWRFVFTISADGTCGGVVCDNNAECIESSSGDSFCKCKSGFSGDGKRCEGLTCFLTVSCFPLLFSPLCYFFLFYAFSDCLLICLFATLLVQSVYMHGNFLNYFMLFLVDINECVSLGLGKCPDKAKCINRFGSFTCHCKRGYMMMNKKCISKSVTISPTNRLVNTQRNLNFGQCLGMAFFVDFWFSLYIIQSIKR